MGKFREPGQFGGGVTDKNVVLAVLLGVICGAGVALFQVTSSRAPTVKTKKEASFGEALVNVAPLGKEQVQVPAVPHRQLESRLRAVEDECASLKAQQAELVQQADKLMREVKAARKAKEAVENERDNLLLQAGKIKIGPPGQIRAKSVFPTLEPDPSANPELAAILEKIAIDREVIIALSNDKVHPMLQTWFESLKRVGVRNLLVVALDNNTVKFCEEHDVPVYSRQVEVSAAQKNVGSNHAVSGLKFHILREFLVLGYNVLLSDADIIFLQDPFKHLVRDCDVEGMSDGTNDQHAYGFDDVDDDPTMGWSRYSHTMRIWVFNSGLFFLRPTAASFELIDRVAARLAKESSWDQAVFNEELFRPSSPGYLGLHATKRVLDYHLFMNSKFLFTKLRKDKASMANSRPISIHVNYHPDKHKRMIALIEYYVNGVRDALDSFPDAWTQ